MPRFDLVGFLRRTVIVLLAAAIAVGIGMLVLMQLQSTDPYTQKVLTLMGNVTQGHAIFLMNCAGCHGEAASGGVGPSLIRVSDHKSRMALIEQVVSGNTPPMPKFQPSPQEMADLLSYLESL